MSALPETMQAVYYPEVSFDLRNWKACSSLATKVLGQIGPLTQHRQHRAARKGGAVRGLRNGSACPRRRIHLAISFDTWA